MRIAVLSPSPRISGVVTYTQHLAEGFRRAGHECDRVTFTKSGKPSVRTTVDAVSQRTNGWSWSTFGADRVSRWADAGDVLSEYDLVVVEEPRCAPLDKQAVRDFGGDLNGRAAAADTMPYESLPAYVRGLQHARRQVWVLHDPGYTPRLAPFLRRLYELAPPDLVVTHREGALESAAWAGLGELTPHVRIDALPYASRPLLDPQKRRLIATTGRYINNKGQPTVMLAAVERPAWLSGWEIAAKGAAPLGAGPNHTFLTYEGLQKRGWTGERDGKDITRGWPWRMALESTRLAFHGAYMDPVIALADARTHVCLTDPAFSGVGSLEYVQLEAIDARCILVMHASRLPADPAMRPAAVMVDTLERLSNAELDHVDEGRKRTALAVASAMAASTTITDARLRDMADENLSVVQKFHAPERYVAQLLERL